MALLFPPPPHCRHPPKRSGDPHPPLPLPTPLPRPLLRYTEGLPPHAASASRGRLGRDAPPASAPPRASPPARGALTHRSQASQRGACVLLKVKHQATSAWCPRAPGAATCRSISPASPPRATSHASPTPPPASPSPHASGAPSSSASCGPSAGGARPSAPAGHKSSCHVPRASAERREGARSGRARRVRLVRGEGRGVSD